MPARHLEVADRERWRRSRRDPFIALDLPEEARTAAGALAARPAPFVLPDLAEEARTAAGALAGRALASEPPRAEVAPEERSEQIEEVSPRTPVGALAGRALASESPRAEDPSATFMGLLPYRLEAGQRQATQARESAARKRATLAELGELAAQQATERDTARPVPPELVKPPATSPRAFLEPGSDTLGQLHAVLLGIGQLVSGVGGVVRGNGIAAVAALKGALEGWQAGDHERVKRSIAEWERQDKTLLEAHRLRRETYADLVADRKTTMAQKLAEIGILAKIDEDEQLALAAETGDIESVMKVLETRATLASAAADRAALLRFRLDQERRRIDEHAATEERLTAADERAARQFKETQALTNMDPKVRHRLSDVMHVDPLKATPEQITEAGAAVKAAALEEDERKRVAMTAEIEARRRAAGETQLDEPIGKDASHFADAQGRPPLPSLSRREVYANYRPYQGKVPPEVSTRITLAALDQALALVPALDKKGLMMAKPGGGQAAWTWFQREVWQRGDPDLDTFVSHTSTAVRTARELGDIGFRTKAAIDGTLNIFEKARTAEGVTKALTQLRNLIVLAAPATVPRRYVGFDTRTNIDVTILFHPGETLEDLPAYIDPYRLRPYTPKR